MCYNLFKCAVTRVPFNTLVILMYPDFQQSYIQLEEGKPGSSKAGSRKSLMGMLDRMELFCMDFYSISWYCMVLHGIAWYCMVIHAISWYCMVWHGATWYCTVLHGIEWYCWYCTILHSTTWYCMVLHNIAW